MKWYHWLWIVVVFLGAALGFYVGRARQGPSDSVNTEIKAIEAADKARKLEVMLGTENTLKEIEAEYDREIKALSEDERDLADSLRDNPGKLAAFLVKAGSRAL